MLLGEIRGDRIIENKNYIKTKESTLVYELFFIFREKTMLIEILDKTIPGDISNSFKIELQEITTPKEIISTRVKEEIINYKNKADSRLQSLVRPLAKEMLLNKKKKKEIDVEKQIYIALEAFQKNGFFVLVDDQQVSELNQKIHLKENSSISFIKLTQLVGG